MVARHNAARRAEASGPPPLSGEGGGGEARALELERLIHERTRLAIVSSLAVNKTMAFTELRDLLDTSDGNLSVHARRLEEAGYITCHKGFAERVPRTEYALTDAGRTALARYLAHMEAIIEATRSARG